MQMKMSALGLCQSLIPKHCRRFLGESRQWQWEVVPVIDGCSGLSEVKQVHAQLYRQGLEQQCLLVSKLIRVLSRAGVPMEPYPLLLFHQVTHPNPFLFTALIRAYTLQGSLSRSLALYSSMRSLRLPPLSFTFSALLKASAALRHPYLGRQLHAHTILIGGFYSDLHVHNTLIHMYAKCGFLASARNVFDQMPLRDVLSWTSLIVALAKSGHVEAAAHLFDTAPHKDIVAWTSMLNVYAQTGRPNQALDFFWRMQQAGVGTDAVTLLGVISACAQLGAINYAHWVRDIAHATGFGPAENVLIGSALVHMYSKCGSLGDAYSVFRGMRKRNVFSYSSMIQGFAMHGRPHAALQLFAEMIKAGVKPNGVTFLGLLTASRHAGMVQLGRRLFAMMKEFYGIEPSADHYACVVDLLSRAGHLEEALDLAKTMPIEPIGAVWGALLGACRIHGNPYIAEIAATHLFELEPDVTANYILLINIYASAGRWGDVSRVRKLMRDKGLKKIPACSWVDAHKAVVIHES